MHGLDFNQAGIARFAYAGIHKPWHHEGVDMPVGADLEVAIAAADMDYQIEKAPLEEGSNIQLELLSEKDNRFKLSVDGGDSLEYQVKL